MPRPPYKNPNEAQDENAPRKHKHIRVPLNEYESNLLDALRKKTGRSRLSTIRWALKKMADDERIPA